MLTSKLLFRTVFLLTAFLLGGLFSLQQFFQTLPFVKPANAQGISFYQRKSITLLVADSAGTGNDRWARAFANHLSKHIPGTPNFIVQNMPGAGGRLAANHFSYSLLQPSRECVIPD
jgi:tripartite-type tricarboxylate transporter receptor subunit TctC